MWLRDLYGDVVCLLKNGKMIEQEELASFVCELELGVVVLYGMG